MVESQLWGNQLIWTLGFACFMGFIFGPFGKTIPKHIICCCYPQHMNLRALRPQICLRGCPSKVDGKCMVNQHIYIYMCVCVFHDKSYFGWCIACFRRTQIILRYTERCLYPHLITMISPVYLQYFPQYTPLLRHIQTTWDDAHVAQPATSWLLISHDCCPSNKSIISCYRLIGDSCFFLDEIKLIRIYKNWLKRWNNISFWWDLLCLLVHSHLTRCVSWGYPIVIQLLIISYSHKIPCYFHQLWRFFGPQPTYGGDLVRYGHRMAQDFFVSSLILLVPFHRQGITRLRH